ncbi:aminotransferase class V-fold PLP-dependent enzyme [Shewanella sp. 10N.286.52.B9]|uniref:aminotransferase class V-fold PLP-dependent enzyme n=1 Tax=Shewanella sp. 10N.286.52.B9 TaxID=1880837 RepID=UPI001F53D63E|nr:aminotransferase class V-fold PLP-dependent enzyme [Shewanella sp. 10N.286.52.B9]
MADEIERHRKGLDANPSDYWHKHFETIDGKISAAAASYMGGEAEQIALTDSTTMGLSLVYSGLKLRPNDEVVQTVHDHYSTDLSLKLRAERTGANVRRITLYETPATVTTQQIIDNLAKAINQKTKVVAVTWVHSSTGVKLPIRAMADVIAKANSSRSEADKILFCVDGVHGFGIEDVDVSTLGCDFFIAGTHKWIFGPRGTGIIWGSKRGWNNCSAVIPSFSLSYDVWLGNSTQAQVPMGEHMSPGGFHSFEHRWALPAAFELHLRLGKANVQQRIHQLNTQTKQGLAKMSHVTLYTPMATELSSGLVCFDVDGLSPQQVVEHMHTKGIIMSSTPYRDSFARFAPSLINNEAEIDKALSEIQALA